MYVVQIWLNIDTIIIRTLIEIIASSFLYMDCTTRSRPSITLELITLCFFIKDTILVPANQLMAAHLIFANAKDKSGVVVDHRSVLQLPLSSLAVNWWKMLYKECKEIKFPWRGWIFLKQISTPGTWQVPHPPTSVSPPLVPVQNWEHMKGTYESCSKFIYLI